MLSYDGMIMLDADEGVSGTLLDIMKCTASIKKKEAGAAEI